MQDLKHRVIVENVSPEIDGGRFFARRAVGEEVRVEADIFADGHDALAAVLSFRKKGADDWSVRHMAHLVNDRWRAGFVVTALGAYEYTIEAWVDRFQTWRDRVEVKFAAGQDVSIEMLEGVELVSAAAEKASGDDAEQLRRYAVPLGEGEAGLGIQTALDPELERLMNRYPDTTHKTAYGKVLTVVVERPRARFSAWYEMFPRSCSSEPGRHGTFEDCIARLPYIASMGFDVLYLPPIHPIGRTHRKGRNNTVVPAPDDTGSPWAIGAEEGGHESIHPSLGTIEDFHRLMTAAKEYEIEIAIDIAFQCSPDHPWVKSHPEWFRNRPDGSIQYAENPPKKYQDIYPFDFESDQAASLAEALLGVMVYWMDQGVRIFRVDNPHTKPHPFWEWLIGECKKRHPEVIFLSEAFTRPKTMYRLAKQGFTQSYTYFTWRNMKWEIEQYFEELTQTTLREFFWPNLWPNTPDILPEYLQIGGRPAFLARLALAATLSSNYGIYGPAFELCVNEPKEPFSEEYLDSEKYEIHHWDLDQPQSIKSFITRINRIRRENAALQQGANLLFHPVDTEEIVCYTRYTDSFDNIVVVVVNLDPHHTHSGWLKLPVEKMGLDPKQTFQMHDLLTGARYLWHADYNYVELDPKIVPVHIFRIRRRLRTERDFDYFM